MLDYSHLKNFRPVVMTPSHNQSVFLNYLVSVIDLVNASRDHNMMVDFYHIGGGKPGDSGAQRRSRGFPGK